MTDTTQARLLAERIETVLALSQLMAEELRLRQAVGGAEIERMGGAASAAATATGAADRAALAACQDRIEDANRTLARIDSQLAAPRPQE